MSTKYLYLIGIAMTLWLCGVTKSSAQIKAPGHDRDLETIESLRAHAVLDRDSVTLIDTVVLYDPETFDESVRIIHSTMSIRDYCTEILGYETPNDLLNGEIITITNPETYEPMKIRWNAARAKIDTIPQRAP